MSTPLATRFRDVWNSAPARLDPERERTRLEVVPTRSQRRARPRAVYAVIAVSTLLAIVVVQLLLSILVTKGAYTLDSLQNTSTALQREQQSVSEQLDTAESPQNLAAEASKLGMVANPNLAYLRLSDSHVLGSPHPAPAAGKAAGVDLVPNALLNAPKKADKAGKESADHHDEAGNSAAPRASEAAETHANVPFRGTLPAPKTH